MDAQLRTKKAEAFELFAAGRSPQEVWRELKLHHSTVSNWHREWERQQMVDRGLLPPTSAGADLDASIKQAAAAAELSPHSLALRPTSPAGLTRQAEGPQFVPGSIWRARINGCEAYGAFAEIMDGEGKVIGKGLIHRSKMFAADCTPRRRWLPEEFIRPGMWQDVRILDARNPLKLELSTAGLLDVDREELPFDQPPAVSTDEDSEWSGPSDGAAPGGRASGPERAPTSDDQLPKPKVRHDLVRVMGEHTAPVAIKALEMALTVLAEVDPAIRVHVYIEIRRTPL